MKVDDFDSLILFVERLSEARAFYVDTLGLPVRFEDESSSSSVDFGTDRLASERPRSR